jgi:hypothetical protein
MLPDGWPCTYEECRPGFFVFGESLFLKSEYGGQGYCGSGEMFCRTDAEVQPVTEVWEEFE